MEVVIIVRDQDELGIPRSEQNQKFPYDIRWNIYDDKQAALDRYAETPCTWSEIHTVQSIKELPALLRKCKENIIKGIK